MIFINYNIFYKNMKSSSVNVFLRMLVGVHKNLGNYLKYPPPLKSYFGDIILEY